MKDVTYLFAFISIIGYIFNIQDKKFTSYVVWLVANILWLIYFITKEEYGSVVLFFVYSIFCIYGILKEDMKNDTEIVKYKKPKKLEVLEKEEEIIEKVPCIEKK